MFNLVRTQIAQHDDSLRFTPLYVIRMMLDIKYGENSNMFIPEVLLEHKLGFEDLLHNLRQIDAIAESGDSERIIKCVTVPGYLIRNLKKI